MLPAGAHRELMCLVVTPLHDVGLCCESMAASDF